MTDSELIIYYPESSPDWAQAVEEFILSVLKKMEVPGYDFSITFCDDRKIQELNKNFRGKDEPTDVLSFEAEGEQNQTGWILGDLFISLDTLQENAIYFSEDPERELKRLIIHGILHLQGWDHSDNSPDQPMIRYQEEVLGTYRKDDWF